MQEKIKNWLSLLLISSIILSVIIVLIGSIAYLAEHGQETVSYQHFSPQIDSLTSFHAILHALAEWQPLAMVELGFLILVFAQVIRVLVLSCYFLRSSEYWLAISSFFIFLVITYSMLWHE